MLPSFSKLERVTITATVSKPVAKERKKEESVKNNIVPTSKIVVQQEFDQSIIQTYNYLVSRIESKVAPLSDELPSLCERISNLEQKEAVIIRDLIAYHRKLYPSATVDIIKSKQYPYDEMKELGNDISVDITKLPSKLVMILREYVDAITNVDDD
jgi:hypothetical protein